jgi:hypothetical protein
MTFLPLEVWSRIAYYACSDGGKTGTTLLRVSKTIARAAENHAYTTIALMGKGDVSSFIRCISRLPSYRRNSIQSLFVSDAEYTYHEGHMARLMHHLISLVSGTLRSLALISYKNYPGRVNDHLFLFMTDISLPALRFLTLRGVAKSFSLRNSRFPALTNLHVYAPPHMFVDYISTFIADHVAISMPNLEHLSISGFHRTNWTRAYLSHFLTLYQPDSTAPVVHPYGTLQESAREVSIFTRPPGNSLRGTEVNETQSTFITTLNAGIGTNRLLEVIEMPDYVAADSAEGWRTFWLDVLVEMEPYSAVYDRV